MEGLAHGIGSLLKICSSCALRLCLARWGAAPCGREALHVLQQHANLFLVLSLPCKSGLENVFDWRRGSLFWQRGENRGEKSVGRNEKPTCEGRVTFSQRSNPRKHCALRCTSFVGRGHSFPACLYAEIASTTYTVPVLLKICSSRTLLCCGAYGMKVLLCSNAKRYKRAT